MRFPLSCSRPRIDIAGVRHSLHEGATLRIPLHVMRQVSAPMPGRALVATGTSCSVTAAGEEPRPLQWGF
jgi:hypothetical protein